MASIRVASLSIVFAMLSSSFVSALAVGGVGDAGLVVGTTCGSLGLVSRSAMVSACSVTVLVYSAWMDISFSNSAARPSASSRSIILRMFSSPLFLFGLNRSSMSSFILMSVFFLDGFGVGDSILALSTSVSFSSQFSDS
ncbi:uncharacterized protein B0H18DRAFT_1031600 [Fomitopsis serialis]|uniref:uncharacterized protein n=1 Tax=Fomitopsis serialis TaxID=139415 RepID=UPI002008C51C|nr:uncharacterized protein B0H18DRAFT_1056917 [Neoantrodia serialis]XP_047888907.1 uncharacterized protein B0H18DRAFT_1031600 [Neoantrodia serialis]KAH9911982.1 hypothetical protein B0H18DRAFT_1056917 [Neoantrodia serialis]KAH9918333.1 hypothetical protein B0H18DRAFT_1031600 [Neoantrodia serialis]